MPRIDSYPNLDNTTVATDDEFVVWDTSGSQVANLPLSALDARFAPAALVLPPINRAVANVYANFPTNGSGWRTDSMNVNGNCFYQPIMLAVGRTADRIGIEVTTAGTAATSVHRIGVWADNNGLPGTLLLDAGTVATDSTGIKEVTISLALASRTIYWLGVAQQGAPASLATLRSSGTTSMTMESSITTTSPCGPFSVSITGAFGSNPTIYGSHQATIRTFLRFT
jgi:hypothetical protein